MFGELWSCFFFPHKLLDVCVCPKTTQNFHVFSSSVRVLRVPLQAAWTAAAERRCKSVLPVRQKGRSWWLSLLFHSSHLAGQHVHSSGLTKSAVCCLLKVLQDTRWETSSVSSVNSCVHRPVEAKTEIRWERKGKIMREYMSFFSLSRWKTRRKGIHEEGCTSSKGPYSQEDWTGDTEVKSILASLTL